MNVSSLWTVSPQLPTILTATSSILLDRCLRHDLIQERFKCQIWMWLVVTLSMYSPHHLSEEEEEEPNKNVAFQSWVHLVLCSNMVCISSMVVHNNNNYNYNIKINNQCSNWLPPATWLAMISTLVIPTASSSSSSSSSDPMLISIQVFCLSVAFLYMVQWHRKRRRQLFVDHSLLFLPQQQQPYSSSSLPVVEERLWYTWNARQTLQWISTMLIETTTTTPTSSSFGDDDDNQQQQQQEECDLVLNLLAPQRIAGDVLDLLTVSSLVHHLKIPYGPACRLAQSISQRLVQLHPKPRQSTSGNNMTTATTTIREESPSPGHHQKMAMIESSLQAAGGEDSWLSKHDQEYNNPNNDGWQDNHSQQQQQQQSINWNEYALPSNKHGFNNEDDLEESFGQQSQHTKVPPMDPRHQERLEKVFKERYGLELPKLHTALSAVVETKDESADPTHPTLAGNNIANQPHQQPTTSSTTMPPNSSFLMDPDNSDDDIPPAVLAQMPPNVQEIAKRRPDLVKDLLRARQRQQEEQQKVLHMEAVEEATRNYESEEEDDETTSLIIQRKPRPKYKSVEGK